MMTTGRKDLGDEKKKKRNWKWTTFRRQKAPCKLIYLLCERKKKEKKLNISAKVYIGITFYSFCKALSPTV